MLRSLLWFSQLLIYLIFLLPCMLAALLISVFKGKKQARQFCFEVSRFACREICELGREMSPVEIFLMKKYKAELAYCHQARVKTNIGIAKEGL